jgi:hypothetical protein
MDVFVWSTIFLGIWGLVSPFVGIRYGQDLARRWQKEHWTNDNARQECRELISTLTRAFTLMLKYHS